MTKKLWIVVIIATVIAIVVVFNSTLPPRRWQAKPEQPINSVSEISNYNPPQEIKFNSATDLKKELESVNPQVLDSDFETE